MISRTSHSIQELAAYLNEKDEEPPAIMAEIRDANGRPITVGARVYVRPRPALCGSEELPGFGGVVKAVAEKCITITEFGSCHTRDMHPADVSVQRGESRASLEHEAMLQAMGKKR